MTDGEAIVKCLVIGGTGFIGSVLTRRLVEHGHSVAVFHRGITKAELPGGVREFLQSDSKLPITAYPSELLEYQPDVVIHTMAMGSDDSAAAVRFFNGNTARMVILSSGDVYGAYGRFIGIESGPPDSNLLTENSQLRKAMYPYRAQAPSTDALQYWYDKILVEKAFTSSETLQTTILRLPKVYGRNQDADLATIFGFRDHPDWRWTHGHVGNVAAAIVLAATHPCAAGRTYNVGEPYTPTIQERLDALPHSEMSVQTTPFDFRHHLAYDTMRIRSELGYSEIIPEGEAMARTFRGETISELDDAPAGGKGGGTAGGKRQ